MSPHLTTLPPAEGVCGNEIQNMPAVLSLHLLSYDELRSIMRWTCKETRWDLHVDLEFGIADWRRKVAVIIKQLADRISSDGRGGVEGDHDTLEMLEACDIIKMHAADDVVLTEKGRRVLVSGHELGEADPLLQKRDIPLKDMSAFELMLELEDKGWRCEVVSKKDKRYKEIRKHIPAW